MHGPSGRQGLGSGWRRSRRAAPSHAAPITRVFSFAASDFAPATPVDPVVGSLTVTFDPAGPSGMLDAAAVTVNNLNIACQVPV